jgi:hypothetical protein
MARCLIVFSAVVTLSLAFSAVRADDEKKVGMEVEANFKKLDANNDGKLSKEEFLRLAERFKDRSKARQRLGSIFDRIAGSLTGITQEQFKRYLESNPKKGPQP